MRHYETCEDSYTHFYRIWSTSDFYGSFPDEGMAKKWSGGDRAGTWLKNVTYVYNNPK